VLLHCALRLPCQPKRARGRTRVFSIDSSALLRWPRVRSRLERACFCPSRARKSASLTACTAAAPAAASAASRPRPAAPPPAPAPP
jgi:hypothetical protein